MKIGTRQKSNCENIEGSLQVNGTVMLPMRLIKIMTQGNQILRYVQDYDVRYTATVTLQDGGLIKETNKATAEGKFIDVNMEGETYRISLKL